MLLHILLHFQCMHSSLREKIIAFFQKTLLFFYAHLYSPISEFIVLYPRIQTRIYIFSQFPFVLLIQTCKIKIRTYSSAVQLYDNYFRSIVDSHRNNTVSNTSAHNHSCSILCIGACVIFREKSLVRSNNSSQKWQSKLSAVGVPRQY